MGPERGPFLHPGQPFVQGLVQCLAEALVGLGPPGGQGPRAFPRTEGQLAWHIPLPLASRSPLVDRWGSTHQEGCRGWCRRWAGTPPLRRGQRSLRNRSLLRQPRDYCSGHQQGHTHHNCHYRSNYRQSSPRSYIRPQPGLGPVAWAGALGLPVLWRVDQA